MIATELPFENFLFNNINMSAKRIAAIRRFYGVTQVKFSELLGVKLVTYQKWAQGVRNPSSPSTSLLYIAEQYPEVFIQHRNRILDQIKRCLGTRN